MVIRLAVLTAACVLVPIAVGAPALAEPEPPGPPVTPVANATPVPDGPVPSAPPGVLETPDGWTLTVFGKDESMTPVPALTGAPTSREYIVSGTFTGAVTGTNITSLTGGTLEAGYQIGCGIIQDSIEPIINAGIAPGFALPFLGEGGIFPLVLGAQASVNTKIALRPGTVTTVPVGKKAFKGTVPRISITGLRIKFDSCAGQSFIRSYATFGAATDNTNDVITYTGVTKIV
ncbi:hypothetical protein MCHIJ_14950 [Mycolicibacterium chitae]|uniref:MspA protein n=1 Tax=Mycolicibacterium chitae TaxID=1792 RepID=A0A3S4VM91_MYCCI|nr:MspA family porin [Mycolicibacterium chitae]MCV7107775.1 MspA family porin [Mycolicibacterium chitae]BBZ02058.1 hypothetical protein MCHIJ_14950 [Mycolicibacterium chitae]VEG50875.1 MspA protein [Mycolicibacterium chitae]